MTAGNSTLPVKSSIPFWRDERVLRFAAQALSVILVVLFFWWIINNLISAANQRGLTFSFRFLQESAGFPLGESPVPYDPSRTFAYAFYVGLLKTLQVSVIGIFLSTILGVVVGVARLSSNWLIAKISFLFIEAHRNIPLLVLLFLWYRGVFLKLPNVSQSIIWPGPVYINQRGMFVTWPRLTESGMVFLISILAGIVIATTAFVLLRRLRESSGRPTYFGLVSLLILFLLPVAGWLLAGGDPIWWDVPVLTGFNFVGGVNLTPEFTALLIGLVTYTAAFIAEVVRAGIQAVQKGQLEAAKAVGLNPTQVLGLVIFPQALRIIIPPLISQYLNLTKNSSLAFFIGFSEIFYIGKVTINQAGRAVQVFLLVMAVYLVLSLITSLVLNLYNRRIQFVER
jgi:general L-amino acid transport system permease protein